MAYCSVLSESIEHADDTVVPFGNKVCFESIAWEAFEPGLQARYTDDLEARYQNAEPWRVRPSILPSH